VDTNPPTVNPDEINFEMTENDVMKAVDEIPDVQPLMVSSMFYLIPIVLY